MKITVIGATGMIGSRIVAEAAQRGHEVTAVSRSGGMTKGASRAAAMELSDTSAVSAAIDASDATVIAVSPDRSGGSHEPTIRAHQTARSAMHWPQCWHLFRSRIQCSGGPWFMC